MFLFYQKERPLVVMEVIDISLSGMISLFVDYEEMAHIGIYKEASFSDVPPLS